MPNPIGGGRVLQASTLSFTDHFTAVRDLKKQAFDVLTRYTNTCSLADTIIVAGAPRSGTTWLAELLRELPGYKFINEPLRLSTNPEAKHAGFGWRTRVPPDESRPELEQHLRGILTDHVELGPAWHFQSSHALGKLVEHIRKDRIVVKFCRAGRMLHWMSRVFCPRGMVVIIRHPCAVIASMLQVGDNWQPKELGAASLADRLAEVVPDRRILRNLAEVSDETNRSWVGHLAMMWSLDHYFAFHDDPSGPDDYPWILTSYERLLTRGIGELERIVEALGGTATEDMSMRLTKASSFAADDFRPEIEHQLAKWQTELSASQIRSVLEVTQAFGLDFYTEKPVPDDCLFQFQSLSERPSAVHDKSMSTS
jgi:hypothetical protein